VALRLQRRAHPFAARLNEPRHLRPATADRRATPYRRLRSADRRHHRPTGHNRSPDSNRCWIKVGATSPPAHKPRGNEPRRTDQIKPNALYRERHHTDHNGRLTAHVRQPSCKRTPCHAILRTRRQENLSEVPSSFLFLRHLIDQVPNHHTIRSEFLVYKL
jgi:hypothetical protein